MLFLVLVFVCICVLYNARCKEVPHALYVKTGQYCCYDARSRKPLACTRLVAHLGLLRLNLNRSLFYIFKKVVRLSHIK